MYLSEYGWDQFFENNFQAYQNQGLIAGRVFMEHKHLYRVYTELGEILAEVSGKFRHKAQRSQDYPAVGDWVILNILPGEERAIIHEFLPRKSKLSRKAAQNETREQIIAANLDTALIVSSLNRDFNPRRLERYLTLVWESGPVIILSKADLCNDLPEKLAQAEAVAFGVPVHVISVYSRTGIDGLSAYFTAAKTVVILGSSGVGKSSLINCLAGKELLKVNSIREDDARGRHTTTHRQLVCLPSGGLIIDTPGMRELALWEADSGMEAIFGDVEELSKLCRFHNCSHGKEPGCAVKEALGTGRLDSKRWENWLKLQKELAHLEAKKEGTVRLQEKQWGKRIAKFQKELR